MAKRKAVRKVDRVSFVKELGRLIRAAGELVKELTKLIVEVGKIVMASPIREIVLAIALLVGYWISR